MNTKEKFFNVLLWINALPVTIFSIWVLILASITKSVKFIRWHNFIAEFEVLENSFFHNKFFLKWAGMSLGVVNLYRFDYKDNEKTIKHERRHSEQIMKLGIFQPILYFGFVLVCYFMFKDRHPYYDNPFELDARYSANQKIDVNWQSKVDEKGNVDRWIWW